MKKLKPVYDIGDLIYHRSGRYPLVVVAQESNPSFLGSKYELAWGMYDNPSIGAGYIEFYIDETNLIQRVHEHEHSSKI